MKANQFDYSIKGYEKAKKYLKKIGKWEYVSSHGSSTDGWSIVHEANSIFNNSLKPRNGGYSKI